MDNAAEKNTAGGGTLPARSSRSVTGMKRKSQLIEGLNDRAMAASTWVGGVGPTVAINVRYARAMGDSAAI
jgi:hypothetical protein